jgi:hypothetical protein
MKSLIICTLTQYCAGDKINKNEVDVACSTYKGGERHVQGFGGDIGQKETTGETQAYMGEYIRMEIKEVGYGGTD